MQILLRVTVFFATEAGGLAPLSTKKRLYFRSNDQLIQKSLIRVKDIPV